MKLDHHDFRMSRGMFKLTPDQITEFAKWLESQGEDVKEFMNKEMNFKREMHSKYSSEASVEEAL